MQANNQIGCVADAQERPVHTATSSSNASQAAEDHSAADHAANMQHAASQPEPCNLQLKDLQVPHSMLHPSFVVSSQNNTSKFHAAQNNDHQDMTDGSLSPSMYNALLDFPELLLHDNFTQQPPMQQGVADQYPPQQLQQQGAVQWYTADADIHEQQASAGSYVVIGADGIQRHVHTANAAETWAEHSQAQQTPLPNIIRKISNETATE